MAREKDDPKRGAAVPLDERDRLLQVAIEERIREALPHEKAVRVQVKRGVVTLRGDVDDAAAARRAKAACRDLPGVEHLVDHLRTRGASGPPR